MHSPVFRGWSVLALPILLVIGVAFAQESKTTPPTTVPNTKKPLKIVPIVTLKPGETKKLLLSTHCTVGATRGGGFQINEMRGGIPKEGQTTGSEGATYSRDGIVISVPGWEAAEKFASSAAYASLKKAGIAVFEVSVSASKEAPSGLLEFHLSDATCSGHCDTDFRVLVESEVQFQTGLEVGESVFRSMKQ